jgi:hypothetical protein
LLRARYRFQQRSLASVPAEHHPGQSIDRAGDNTGEVQCFLVLNFEMIDGFIA